MDNNYLGLWLIIDILINESTGWRGMQVNID